MQDIARSSKEFKRTPRQNQDKILPDAKKPIDELARTGREEGERGGVGSGGIYSSAQLQMFIIPHGGPQGGERERSLLTRSLQEFAQAERKDPSDFCRLSLPRKH
jgi:hypothetical protein